MYNFKVILKHLLYCYPPHPELEIERVFGKSTNCTQLCFQKPSLRVSIE